MISTIIQLIPSPPLISKETLIYKPSVPYGIRYRWLGFRHHQPFFPLCIILQHDPKTSPAIGFITDVIRIGLEFGLLSGLTNVSNAVSISNKVGYRVPVLAIEYEFLHFF